jgi:ribosome-associated protein
LALEKPNYYRITTLARKKQTSASTEETAQKRPIFDLVVKSLDDDQAQDIVTIDLAGKSAMADAMVVASGRSQRHVGAIADHLLRQLKESGQKNVKIEGKTAGDWVLVDAGDVIIHIFRPEVREFYNLEKMWTMDVEAFETSGSTGGLAEVDKPKLSQ